MGEEWHNAVKEIREELDEHLECLNQNTAELAASHEYLGEIEAKLEKLTERVDALQALLLSQTPASKTALKLTSKEKDVLHVLQSSSEPLSSNEIGKRAGLTQDLTAQTLFCLKQKGVHVLASTLKDETFYALDVRFNVPDYNL
jgi:hypothetical protein